MLKGTFPIEKFKKLETPFYYYDIKLLQETLNVVKAESGKYGYHVHYAIKANANPRLLSLIAQNGFGADCVSGGEIKAALEAGFPNDKIVFAGVGKADWEINLGLDNDIFCFNVESIAELDAYARQDHDRDEGEQVRYQPEPIAHYPRTDERHATCQTDRYPLPHRLTDYRHVRFPQPRYSHERDPGGTGEIRHERRKLELWRRPGHRLLPPEPPAYSGIR